MKLGDEVSPRPRDYWIYDTHVRPSITDVTRNGFRRWDRVHIAGRRPCRLNPVAWELPHTDVGVAHVSINPYVSS